MDQQATKKISEYTPISEIHYNQDTTQKQDFPEVLQLAREKEELIKWLISQLNEAKKVCFELTKENNDDIQTQLIILKRIIEESWERVHLSQNNEQQSVDEFSASEFDNQSGVTQFNQDNLALKASEFIQQTVEHPSQQEEQFEMRRGSEQFRSTEQHSDHNQSHYLQQQQQNQQIMDQGEAGQQPIEHYQDTELHQRHLELKEKYKQSLENQRKKFIVLKQRNVENFRDIIEQLKEECRQIINGDKMKIQRNILEFQEQLQHLVNEQISSQQSFIQNQLNSQQQQQNQVIINENQSSQEEYRQQKTIQKQKLSLLKNQIQNIKKQNIEMKKIFISELKKKSAILQDQLKKETSEYQSKLKKQQQQQSQKQQADFQKIKELSDRLSQQEQQYKNAQKIIEDQNQEIIQLVEIQQQLTTENQNLKTISNLNQISDIKIREILLTLQKQQEATLNINQQAARDLQQMPELNNQIEDIRRSITGDFKQQISELQELLKEKDLEINNLQQDNLKLQERLKQNDLSGQLKDTLEKLQQKEEIIRKTTEENKSKTNLLQKFQNELKLLQEFINNENQAYKQKVQKEFEEILRYQLEGNYNLQYSSLVYLFMTLKIFRQYLISENQPLQNIDEQLKNLNNFNEKLQKKEHLQNREPQIIKQSYQDLNKTIEEMIKKTKSEYEQLVSKIKDRRERN